MMWLHKYEPKTLDDFVSNKKFNLQIKTTIFKIIICL